RPAAVAIGQRRADRRPRQLAVLVAVGADRVDERPVPERLDLDAPQARAGHLDDALAARRQLAHDDRLVVAEVRHAITGAREARRAVRTERHAVVAHVGAGEVAPRAGARVEERELAGAERDEPATVARVADERVDRLAVAG